MKPVKRKKKAQYGSSQPKDATSESAAEYRWNKERIYNPLSIEDIANTDTFLKKAKQKYKSFPQQKHGGRLKKKK